MKQASRFLAPVALLSPLTAFAAVDVTDVVADIAAAATPIALIAGAVLAVLVGIKVFKWVRRSM